MAWLGKVSLGGFPDLAGAVTKLSESVKNIEKNFDSALGLEEKSDAGEASGIWPLAQDTKTLFEPMMAFMGQKGGDEGADDQSEKKESTEDSSEMALKENDASEGNIQISSQASDIAPEEFSEKKHEVEAKVLQDETSLTSVSEISGDNVPSEDSKSETSVSINPPEISENSPAPDSQEKEVSSSSEAVDVVHNDSPESSEVAKTDSVSPDQSASNESNDQLQDLLSKSDNSNLDVRSEIVDGRSHEREIKVSRKIETEAMETESKVKKLEKELKMMENALQGAARQSQSKADEIAKLMNENEQLKATIEDLKRKNSESDTDSLREEYHQRVAALERKVYALTRERDTLRREQSKKSDAAALLKEKDEIISQVMAEGEELSKKQATQEATMRKLRAQIRELEEEKQKLSSKLQVEETRVESMKKDKAMTEKLLQETIEKSQIELSSQKEFYTNALNVAKEAEALAEARANDVAKIELESRLREANEREHELARSLNQLRQTLVKTQEEADFREDMLKRDIDELQKRYQASELRYNELITQVPDSTRPLLRQIEAMQEAATRKGEAWDAVEKNLNARLEAAEARAAAAEEKERSMTERLSQTSSRMTILETQIACLRTEQAQLTRSLEKERQRASENRQEYLAVMEEAATLESRAKQLEDELRELKAKYKQRLQEEQSLRELLEKDLERERNAKAELEKMVHLDKAAAPQGLASKYSPNYAENGDIALRKLSSAGSLSSIEESFFLRTSLGSADDAMSERANPVEATTISSLYLKSMTPNAFEATLRQKEGELASYISRLASLEAIRDSLAEELVKMTEQCEKLRAESALLPGVRAELEALRRRHASALELMGERDEELEELRADIVDLKEMYREQVDLLVNKIQTLTSG